MNNINRKYKDRLFAFIFGNPEHPEWTLSLYNAVNNSAYTDASAIQINTISDYIYMGMKNDVSFIIGCVISLYEQQSSYNPNMPVRQLINLAQLYEKYIKQTRQNIYGSRQVTLPLPKLLTFYNGKIYKPDTILRLSDSFHPDLDPSCSDVDVKVHMVNINLNHDSIILDKCRVLYEYSWIVHHIRKYETPIGTVAAIDKTMDIIPKDFLLRPFLIVHKTEVNNMLFNEYDEEETMQLFKEEGIKEGREAGIKEGIKQGQKEGFKGGLKQGLQEAEISTTISAIKSVMESFKVPLDKAMDALNIPQDKRDTYASMI